MLNHVVFHLCTPGRYNRDAEEPVEEEDSSIEPYDVLLESGLLFRDQALYVGDEAKTPALDEGYDPEGADYEFADDPLVSLSGELVTGTVKAVDAGGLTVEFEHAGQTLTVRGGALMGSSLYMVGVGVGGKGPGPCWNGEEEAWRKRSFQILGLGVGCGGRSWAAATRGVDVLQEGTWVDSLVVKLWESHTEALGSRRASSTARPTAAKTSKRLVPEHGSICRV